LSKEEKTSILTYSKDRSERRKAKANVTDTSSATQANVHDITSPDESDKDEESDNEEEPKIQVNNVISKARSEAHPGDPRRVLGSTKSKESKDDTKTRLEAMHHCISYDDSKSSEDDDDFDEYWKSQQDFHQGCR